MRIIAIIMLITSKKELLVLCVQFVVAPRMLKTSHPYSTALCQEKLFACALAVCSGGKGRIGLCGAEGGRRGEGEETAQHRGEFHCPSGKQPHSNTRF